MPHPKTRPTPDQNAPFAVAFQTWMDRTRRTSQSLAAELGVSTRTVDRWRSGEAVPDQSRRAQLEGWGAPPLERAKKGPAANRRIERLLEEIVERLKRIEARLP